MRDYSSEHDYRNNQATQYQETVSPLSACTEKNHSLNPLSGWQIHEKDACVVSLFLITDTILSWIFYTAENDDSAEYK